MKTTPSTKPFTVYAAGEEIEGAPVATALMASRGAAVKIDPVSGVTVRIVNNHAALPGINIWNATLSDRLTLRFDDVADQLRIYFPSPTLAKLITTKGVLVRDEARAVVCWSDDLRSGEFDAGYGGPAMSVSRGLLLRRLAARLQAPLASDVRFEAEVSSDLPGVQELSRFVLRLLEPDNQEILSQSLEASESMSKAIIDMVLDIFPSNYTPVSSRGRPSPYPHYIRRCLNFIAKVEDISQVNVDVMARHAGVSKRALQYGFQSFLACTPHAYLRMERLNRARKALLEERAGLAEIALRHGYSNPARFSREFEERFGVRPLALKREQGLE